MTGSLFTRAGVKAAAVAAALSLGALALPGEAEAGRRGGGAAAAAIAGIAAAVIIGTMIEQSHRDRAYHGYYAAQPPPYGPAPRDHAPAYAHGGSGLEPWTPAWYDDCARRYRSFDPRTGTYQPYHGPRRFCR